MDCDRQATGVVSRFRGSARLLQYRVRTCALCTALGVLCGCGLNQAASSVLINYQHSNVTSVHRTSRCTIQSSSSILIRVPFLSPPLPRPYGWPCNSKPAGCKPYPGAHFPKECNAKTGLPWVSYKFRFVERCSRTCQIRRCNALFCFGFWFGVGVGLPPVLTRPCMHCCGCLHLVEIFATHQVDCDGIFNTKVMAELDYGRWMTFNKQVKTKNKKKRTGARAPSDHSVTHPSCRESARETLVDCVCLSPVDGITATPSMRWPKARAFR